MVRRGDVFYRVSRSRKIETTKSNYFRKCSNFAVIHRTNAIRNIESVVIENIGDTFERIGRYFRYPFLKFSYLLLYTKCEGIRTFTHTHTHTRAKNISYRWRKHKDVRLNRSIDNRIVRKLLAKEAEWIDLYLHVLLLCTRQSSFISLYIPARVQTNLTKNHWSRTRSPRRRSTRFLPREVPDTLGTFRFWRVRLYFIVSSGRIALLFENRISRDVGATYDWYPSCHASSLRDLKRNKSFLFLFHVVPARRAVFYLKG